MPRGSVAIILFALATYCLAAPVGLNADLDSLYRLYAGGELAAAEGLLAQLAERYKRPADRFLIELERADYLLDKQHDYAGAERILTELATQHLKHKLLPDVLYRLALAQELQGKFIDAARNYEKVATRYSQTKFGTDALDAIERCFRKNYQERVAYVDGYPITRIELDDRISRNPSAYESYESKLALLDSMIEYRLLYAAAITAGVTRNPAFIEEFREGRNRALFSEWYERTVTSRAQPTDKEITAAYNRDRASRYTTPEKVHGWQILVATRAEAESVRRLLLTDATQVWDSVARRSSLAPDKERGGDMGLFARGVHLKEIEDAAFRLAVGQISQPIKTKDGFVILRVTEKKSQSVRPLTEVKSSIAADLRQQNTTRLYDAAVAELKRKANIAADSLALEQNRETLAIVNGRAITRAMLDERINAIPPFFRSQFDSPEGRRRILDQMILERLLAVEAERQKLWLVNKVVDNLLSRRNALIVDTYRQMMIRDKVKLDSAALYAEYQATIADFKEPTRIHVREITAATRERAEQLRRWAVAGRLPPMIHGRGLLVPDTTANTALLAAIRSGASIESIVAQHALAPTPKQLPRLTLIQAGGKSLPDIGAHQSLVGPYPFGLTAYGLAFADFTREDRLYTPEPIDVGTLERLRELAGSRLDSAALADSLRLGTYLRLTLPLPAHVASALHDPNRTGVVEITLPAGQLLLQTTRRDTAQKATFADIARRFSGASTRWSGGDLYWIARDDKAQNPKLVKAAFALPVGGISPVSKLDDSTWVFVTNEELKPAHTRPFSEVRSKIENKLRRNQEAQLAEELRRSLRDRAQIEIVMKESDFVTEPIPDEATPETTPSQK